MYAGLNAYRDPGLQGHKNAANLITAINQAVMQGGAGGEASQALTYRVFAQTGITIRIRWSTTPRCREMFEHP